MLLLYAPAYSQPFGIDHSSLLNTYVDRLVMEDQRQHIAS
jgi:hypothetical protein